MAQWPEIDAFLDAKGIQFGAPTVGQTIGGTHTTGSEHYEGRARDYGRNNSAAAAIVAALVPYATGPNYVVDELFSSVENVFLDKGVPFTPSAALRTQHMNHVHVGMRLGAHFTDAGAGNGAPAGATTGDNAESVSKSVGTLTSYSTGVRIVKVFAGVGLTVMGIRFVTSNGAPA